MILITGGGGFLGSNLARYLLDQGERVLVMFHRPFQVPSLLAPFWDNQAKGVVSDIMDLPHLCSLTKEYSVESIIHCALTLGKTPYQVTTVNMIGTTNVLEVGRIFGLRRVSFFSSQTVYYGRRISSPQREHEDADLPVTFEGVIPVMKKAGEQVCFFYAREYGLPVLILRISRGYGPLPHPGGNPIDVMVESAVAQKVADLSQVYGDRKTNNIYVKDIAKAVGLIHLAEAPKHNIYNIGDDTSRSWLEFAEVVRRVIPDAKIKLGTAKSAKDVDTYLDIGRIKEEVGFTPDYDPEHAIRDYIEWLRKGR